MKPIKFKHYAIADTTEEEAAHASATLAINADFPDIKKIVKAGQTYGPIFAKERESLNAIYADTAKKTSKLSTEIIKYYNACLEGGMSESDAGETTRGLYQAALIDGGGAKRSVQRYFERFFVEDADGKEIAIFKQRNTAARTKPATIAKRAVESMIAAKGTVIDFLVAAQEAGLRVGDRDALLVLVNELAPAPVAK